MVLIGALLATLLLVVAIIGLFISVISGWSYLYMFYMLVKQMKALLAVLLDCSKSSEIQKLQKALAEELDRMEAEV